MTSPADVIAEVIVGVLDPMADDFPADDAADAAIAALKEAGYEIIKPKPSEEVHTRWSGDVIYRESFWLTPQEARDDAAALIHGANLAESDERLQ